MLYLKHANFILLLKFLQKLSQLKMRMYYKNMFPCNDPFDPSQIMVLGPKDFYAEYYIVISL